MSDTQFRETDLPDSPVGAPGMNSMTGSMAKDYAIYKGKIYPLGHVLFFDSGIEVVAKRHGWEKTGNTR